MSQTTALMTFLKKHRTITPLQALTEMQCFRLAARVNELRNKGVKITTTMIKVSGDKMVAQYRLVK